MATPDGKKSEAFTLVELLVVMAVIALLLTLVMPTLSAAKDQARQVVCSSNARQLALANMGYATENNDRYVLAAADLLDTCGGFERWHGRRDNPDQPFDPLRGPLVHYLGDGRVKQCPQRVDFLRDQEWDQNFEQGCGGYGYNMIYLGSQLWRFRLTAAMSRDQMINAERLAYSRSSRWTEPAHPSETLMFADTALAVLDQNSQPRYIEYSFAEPPFQLDNGEPRDGCYLSPSIHFRHRGRAVVAWADAHVSTELPAPYPEDNQENIYGVNSADALLGWFAPLNNDPFDLD